MARVGKEELSEEERLRLFETLKPKLLRMEQRVLGKATSRISEIVNFAKREIETKERQELIHTTYFDFEIDGGAVLTHQTSRLPDGSTSNYWYSQEGAEIDFENPHRSVSTDKLGDFAVTRTDQLHGKKGEKHINMRFKSSKQGKDSQVRVGIDSVELESGGNAFPEHPIENDEEWKGLIDDTIVATDKEEYLAVEDRKRIRYRGRLIYLGSNRPTRFTNNPGEDIYNALKREEREKVLAEIEGRLKSDPDYKLPDGVSSEDLERFHNFTNRGIEGGERRIRGTDDRRFQDEDDFRRGSDRHFRRGPN